MIDCRYLKIFAILLAAAGFAVANAQSTIYRCQDENGGVLISNNSRSGKNCRAVVRRPVNSLPAPKMRAPSRHNASAGKQNKTSAAASFPRVQEDTQRARDNDRRHILQQELASEKQSLNQAQNELAALKTKPDSEQAKPYQERVGLHQRNIQAIEKELGKIR